MTVALAAALIISGCTAGDDRDDGDQGVRPIDEDSRPDDDAASDDSSPEPDDEPDSEPEPEPDPERDPFAIPDDIDEAYVDLVMNELLAVDSAILRDVLSREVADDLQDEDYERIRAVAGGPQLIENGENFLRYATDADSRGSFMRADELGVIRWTTQRIMEADDTCIVAIGYYDLNDVSVEPYDEDQSVIASLAPAPAVRDDVKAHNPTLGVSTI